MKSFWQKSSPAFKWVAGVASGALAISIAAAMNFVAGAIVVFQHLLRLAAGFGPDLRRSRTHTRAGP